VGQLSAGDDGNRWAENEVLSEEGMDWTCIESVEPIYAALVANVQHGKDVEDMLLYIETDIFARIDASFQSICVYLTMLITGEIEVRVHSRYCYAVSLIFL
jgi:hypothetical protein